MAFKNEKPQNSFKELRAMSGMTQKAFSEYFGMSKRAVENWETGTRKIPDYVFNMIKYILENENFIKN